jgi:predicted dehydrogenase
VPFDSDDIDYISRYAKYRGPRIGVVGSGFIVEQVQLPAYARAGFPVVAIASRTPGRARAVADGFGIGTAYDDWRRLIEDPSIEILDLAFPPDQQPELIAAAVQAGHVRGILAQKPLALEYSAAAEVVRLCDQAGVALAVNQNMRFDQSIRSLKGLLECGRLGDPVMAEIVMHFRIDWQPYAAGYDRKAMLIMSIHHMDSFRFLFGEPERVIASTRPDAGPDPAPVDQMAVYILEYGSDLRAVAIDNCYAWGHTGITWRVDGTDGLASGTIGWPDHPWGSASTIDFTSRAAPDVTVSPRWPQRWFPDAFVGTMGQLLKAVAEGGEPEISGRDNLGTVALLDAAYLSAASHRAVTPAEIVAAAEPG